MPAWIKARAERLVPEMRKTYGPEKAKQVAWAVSTQQAHATSKSPKTWKGEPFGTREGRREAKAKYNHPSQMRKTALGEVFDLMGVKTAIVVNQSRESWDPNATDEPDSITIYPESTPPTPEDMRRYRQEYPTPDLKGETKAGSGEPTEDQLVEFFTRNPNPADEEFHEWAESNGWDTDKAEAAAYRLATRHAEFMTGGKSGKENKKPSDFSADQVAKGVKVEKEHTDNLADRAKITADHLTEKDKYYDDPLFKSDLQEGKTATVRAPVEELLGAATFVLGAMAQAR